MNEEVHSVHSHHRKQQLTIAESLQIDHDRPALSKFQITVPL